MRNLKSVFLIFSVLLVGVASAKNLSAKEVKDLYMGMDGTVVYQLTDGTIDSLIDSITPAGSNVYGPIVLGKSNCDQAQYARVYTSDNTFASGESVVVQYVLSAGPSFNDIQGSYTTQAGDTVIGTTGKAHTAINLSATAAKYMFVKILSIDGAVAYVRNKVRVVLQFRCH